MATPTVTKSKKRVLDKILAILIYTEYAGSARTSEAKIGGATVKKAAGRVWVSAGVPSGGTGVAENDICLDTTNDDVYRYYDAWYKLNVSS